MIDHTYILERRSKLLQDLKMTDKNCQIYIGGVLHDMKLFDNNVILIKRQDGKDDNWVKLPDNISPKCEIFYSHKKPLTVKDLMVGNAFCFNDYTHDEDQFYLMTNEGTYRYDPNSYPQGTPRVLDNEQPVVLVKPEVTISDDVEATHTLTTGSIYSYNDSHACIYLGNCDCCLFENGDIYFIHFNDDVIDCVKFVEHKVTNVEWTPVETIEAHELYTRERKKDE